LQGLTQVRVIPVERPVTKDGVDGPNRWGSPCKESTSLKNYYGRPDILIKTKCKELPFSSAEIALRPSELILKYGFRFQRRHKTCMSLEDLSGPYSLCDDSVTS